MPDLQSCAVFSNYLNLGSVTNSLLLTDDDYYDDDGEDDPDTLKDPLYQVDLQVILNVWQWMFNFDICPADINEMLFHSN